MLLEGLLFLAMGSANPPEDSQAKHLEPIGAGLAKCTEWVFHHGNADSVALQEDEWFAGFLSGVNTFDKQRKHSYFHDDLQFLTRLITSACSRDTNKTLFDIATNMVQSMDQVAAEERAASEKICGPIADQQALHPMPEKQRENLKSEMIGQIEIAIEGVFKAPSHIYSRVDHSEEWTYDRLSLIDGCRTYYAAVVLTFRSGKVVSVEFP